MQAHHDAVKDTITWLEKNATYTRRGKGGVAQVDVHGLIAAAFTHRDSRAGDPDLHTHVAVSNKVQALDGTWLALDGRPFFKNNRDDVHVWPDPAVRDGHTEGVGHQRVAWWLSMDQPTTRREKTSRITQQYTLPSRVGCSVMSVTHT